MVKSGQLPLKLQQQASCREKARPATCSCRQGKLLSGCYHGTAPAEPTKQRRTGQACMYIRLPYTAARCSAAVHHLTYLLRDGVTCDAAMCLSGGDLFFFLILSLMDDLHVSHVRGWSSPQGGVSTLRRAPRRASG